MTCPAPPVSPARLLQLFCPGNPGLHPAIAFPVIIAGTGAKPWTFASDGETMAVWTKRKLVGYKDWQPTGSPDGFSPREWIARYRAGASTPRPLPGSATKLPVEAEWLGHVCAITTAAARLLNHFDACWIGGGSARPVSGRWPWISFHAVLDGRFFEGVLKGV